MIITLSGGIGSGKDTIANFLCAERGFVKLSFADSLKDAVAAIFGLDRDMLEGNTPESRAWREELLPYWDEVLDLDQPVTARLILELVGTEVFRKFCPDIWVYSLMDKAKHFRDEGTSVVITDCRFINELKRLDKMGALQLGTFRHHEPWERAFYAVLRKHNITPDIDWQDPDSVSTLETISKLIKLSGVKVHRSRWEFLLWNRYAKVLHNTASLQSLYHQVDTAIWDHVNK